MLEWSYLISTTVARVCAGVVVALALIGFLTSDTGYLTPILVAVGVSWTVMLLQLVIHRRSTRLLRGG